jgi:two-component system, cell cycle sensor histidine kinase and response regulator CckA
MPNTLEPTLESRLVDAVQQSVVATDLEGRITFWNAHASRMFGWSREEALGQSVVEVTTSNTSREEGEEIFAQLSRGESWAGEFPLRRKDGSTFTAFVVNSPIFDDAGVLVGVVGVTTDVSASRALEVQLRQALKLEAVGRLASGIAHDFNNLITIILGSLDVVLDGGGIAAADRAQLIAARQASEHAAELTRQLLTYTRKEQLQPRVLSIADALAALVPTLRRLMPANLEIGVECDAVPMHTMLDPRQFDQLIVNLVANARDAMPNGGRCTIRAQAVRALMASADATANGAYFRLDVIDTGVGIPTDILPHIFEPFFTTRQPGTSTGLGLATVYSITEQAGGRVEVASAPGSGSTFSVLLPRCAPAGQEPVLARHTRSGNNATILVAEDEPTLNVLIVRILMNAGYNVVSCDNGDEALATALEDSSRFDLVLTDVVMPGINGFELAANVLEQCPNTKILMMTGYAPDEMVRPEILAHTTLLSKPFGPPDLLRAVSAALSQGAHL